MKKRLLSILLALCMTLALLPGYALGFDAPEKSEPLHDATMSVQDWQVLRQVNRHRMSINLNPLSVFEALQKSANQRVFELISQYSHTRPDGSAFSTVFADYAVPSYNTSEENIAVGYAASSAVMDGWLNSEPHRANIENAGMTHLGVGYRGAGSDHPNYWSQNFIGSSACRFSNLQLSAENIAGLPGTDLETLLSSADITVTAACSLHGTCRLPLIAAMCSGYNSNSSAPQTLTVTYGGQTTTLYVTGTSHDHIWSAYKFEGEPTGDFKCDYCDTVISESLKKAYDTVMALNEKTYPRTASQIRTEIKEYILGQVSERLSNLGKFSGTVTEIDYSLPQNGKDGAYVYTVTIQPYERAGYVTTAPVTLILPADGGTDATYYISIPTPNGGQVIPSTRHAAQGDRVTLSVYADTGFVLSNLTVTDIRSRTLTLHDSGDGNYSFTMPSNQVTVEANFKKKAETADKEPLPFTDVHSTDWYYNNVDYVWKHSLMSGVSDSQFAPMSSTSRAMIWTVLARMHNVRTDVNSGSSWYERGMLWALQQGISDGSNPLTDITREQLAAMLWRNAGCPAAAGSLSRFSDSGSVSPYAQTAMIWAVSNHILLGDNGRLNPQGAATRAEVAAMIMRCAENIA